MRKTYNELVAYAGNSNGVHTSHFPRRNWRKAILHGHVQIVSYFFDNGFRVRITDKGRDLLAQNKTNVQQKDA